VVFLFVVAGVIVYWFRRRNRRQGNSEQASLVFPGQELTDSFVDWKNCKLIPNQQQAGDFINIAGPGQHVETILSLEQCANAAQSVGRIVGHNGMATCFRVGDHYIMTAWHVVSTLIGNGK